LCGGGGGGSGGGDGGGARAAADQIMRRQPRRRLRGLPWVYMGKRGGWGEGRGKRMMAIDC